LSSNPQQQLSPLTVGAARARQGVSEHQGMQKSLPPSAQGLSDPFQLSASTVFLTALWETNHRRDSPSGLTWAGVKVCTGLADLAMHVCRGHRWVTLGCEGGGRG